MFLPMQISTNSYQKEAPSQVTQLEPTYSMLIRECGPWNQRLPSCGMRFLAPIHNELEQTQTLYNLWLWRRNVEGRICRLRRCVPTEGFLKY
ncbi:hypothetical protein BC936DRAFT_136807 [Jimgerdemannia flammicorona]|uniref:Uncharacterized protein n=1 Tax=Jimgerdemannia flammicorona TaxID=994334 RepID=A0A433CYS0_9FUNG|nr:hypothetical protein BC936DRAFT_136807 [Jimgerdemannia flammicorona]